MLAISVLRRCPWRRPLSRTTASRPRIDAPATPERC
jgi:hypothetical protein